MKFSLLAILVALVAAHGFVTPSPPSTRQGTKLFSSPMDEERMKEILKEEAMNPENLKASAEMMKNMKVEDIDNALQELEKMSPAQKEQMKKLGMDPNLMKNSMQMMRNNPSMMKSVGEMMGKLTPEEMLERSRAAQEQMSKLTPEQVELAQMAASGMSPEEVSQAAEEVMKATPVVEEEEEEEETEIIEGTSAGDPQVLDAMFRVAELMSQPPTGGVTRQAFASLPPITLLSGDREEDLSKSELAECWADGALGSTRVDRTGFERVWKEVQEYFEGDIMEEARKTSVKKTKKRGTVKPIVTPTSTVGSSISPDQLSSEVKKMSDQDMDMMLDQMKEMTPEQEARLKTMGVDPTMMRKTAEMMKNNPLMKKAATTMMKNMSPEMMMKASQQAQEQMKNMSQEDIDKALDAMNKGESKS